LKGTTMKFAEDLNPRTMPDGVVLILNVRYRAEEGDRQNRKIYSHVALKADGFWYLTGSRAPQVAGWGAVENWLNRDNRELVSVEIQTGSRTIWPEPVGADDLDATPGSAGADTAP
jgi:hypothetical protein